MIERVAVVAAVIGGLTLAGAGVAAADQDVWGVAGDSSGAVTGNSVQVPVNVPVDVCGNTVSVAGDWNVADSGTCSVH